MVSSPSQLICVRTVFSRSLKFSPYVHPLCQEAISKSGERTWLTCDVCLRWDRKVLSVYKTDPLYIYLYTKEYRCVFVLISPECRGSIYGIYVRWKGQLIAYCVLIAKQLHALNGVVIRKPLSLPVRLRERNIGSTCSVLSCRYITALWHVGTTPLIYFTYNYMHTYKYLSYIYICVFFSFVQ